MPTRTVPFLLLLLALSAQGQQPMMAPQSNGNRMWADREIRPEPARTADLQAARVRSIHQDAQELSALRPPCKLNCNCCRRACCTKILRAI